MFAAETQEIFFLLGGESSIGDGEEEILLKLRHRLLMFLGCEFIVHRAAALGIEKFHPRLGQVARRFLQAGTEQLRQRIAGLIFERQFLLPPAQQFPAMFLDQFVTRISPRIKAKPLVEI